jgi:serine/threonine-protein kinase
MTTQEDRAPLSTEISTRETEVDPQASCRSDSTGRGTDPSESDVAPDGRFASGQTLSGRYRIERQLGEGGMGVVYLVTDEQVPGERFAIKVLKEELQPQALMLLREEVRKTRKLSHPNIIDVHSVNLDAHRVYVLMEYLEGKSLAQLLDEEFGRGMPFSHAWPIIEDVGAALGYAHDHNVIHSDLKPANVFVTTSGRTKLLDFGIARISRSPLLHTRSGPRALTPRYASCEMLEGKEADARDDIHSFACVIYEMLCGKRPFGELTALEAREARAQVPLLQVLSREQNAALAQALDFERQGRTGSVEELLSGLADKKSRRRQTAVLGVIAAVAALGLTYFALEKLLISRQSAVVQSSAPLPAATPVAFNPPPHSIAVLPFVNMSGDKEQEYFSDGLTEELLNSLAEINELQVAARTSAFSFKGTNTDIATIARKLNVGTVLEGSVRRSGNTVRVSTQLINAVTGFHLWTHTYDRDLGDVLKLETEIAGAVASALKVNLLGDLATKIELGGTHDPAALDAFLRGRKAHRDWYADSKDIAPVIAAYTEAIGRDPNFALAFANRSVAFVALGDNLSGPAMRENFDKALSDAREAIALAPDLAEGHVSLADYFEDGALDFARASVEYERAIALAPGSARVLGDYSSFASRMGRTEAGIAAARRAVVLDPLSPLRHSQLGDVFLYGRQYKEALAAYQDAFDLDPENSSNVARPFAYYLLGDFESARVLCERKREASDNQLCLAIVYDKLGRHADAEKMLAKIKATLGDDGAYGYAAIYAQWGDIPKGLEWLDTALRVRDPSLQLLKVDPMLDPLRKEPRFQAIERALKFPN